MDTPAPHGYIPPTPPRPRGDDGAYRVVLDEDVTVNFTEYFTESDDEEEGDGQIANTHQRTVSYPKTLCRVTPIPGTKTI